MRCSNLLNSAIETFRNYTKTHNTIWTTKSIKDENITATPTQSGLNSSVTNSLWNTTDIVILFPRTGDDYTIYKNIMYENIILKVENRNVLKVPLSSI
jgi:hypothetical protein